jgi:hypothetical protein
MKPALSQQPCRWRACCDRAGRRAAYSEPVVSIHSLLEFPVKPFISAVFVIAMGALVSGCAGTGSAGSGASASGATGGSGITVFGTIDAGVSNTTNKSR